MAFRFPLATVLRVRLLREEQEEGVLQQILIEIARTRNAVLSVAGQLEQLNHDSTRSHHREVFGRDLHLSRKDFEQLKYCQTELEVQLEKLEQLREAQLIRYQAARQNRELLANMRNRQHTAHLTEMAKREQRNLDGFYLMRRRTN